MTPSTLRKLLTYFFQIYSENNECFTIARRVGATENNREGIAHLPFDLVAKLAKYDVNVPDLYRNVEECANNIGGDPLTSSVPVAGGLPKCFYKLPFVRANGGMCQWFESGEAGRYSPEIRDSLFSPDPCQTAVDIVG